MRMVLDHERDHPSRWAAVIFIAKMIGSVPQTLHEWLKMAEVDTGKRAGVPTAQTPALKRRGPVQLIGDEQAVMIG